MDEHFNSDSSWNEASNYFNRIDQLLQGSNIASVQEDYWTQYKCLFAVHRELTGQMNDKEQAKAIELSFKARNIVRQKNTDINLVINNLFSYETYLRLIMKLRKMDLPRSKDPGRAIIGG